MRKKCPFCKKGNLQLFDVEDDLKLFNCNNESCDQITAFEKNKKGKWSVSESLAIGASGVTILGFLGLENIEDLEYWLDSF